MIDVRVVRVVRGDIYIQTCLAGNSNCCWSYCSIGSRFTTPPLLPSPATETLVSVGGREEEEEEEEEVEGGGAESDAEGWDL